VACDLVGPVPADDEHAGAYEYIPGGLAQDLGGRLVEC